MKADDWKWFYLKELFSIDTGKDLIYSELEHGVYPVIGHKAEDNGVTAYTTYLSTYKLYDYNKTISLADRGNFYATVQSHDFYVGTRVKALVAKFDANVVRLLFICVSINKEQYRFCYGRNCCDRIDQFQIKLPVTSKGTPDWQYMETFVKDQIIPQLPKKAQKVWLQKYETAPVKDEAITLNKEMWHWFEVGSILQCKATKHSIIYDQQKGSFPLVSRSASNNGITASVDADIDCLNNGNCITIGAEGLYAFYQPDDFVAGVKVYTLRQANLNPYNAQFLCTILNREVYRYSYGNARILDKIKKEKIKLPAIMNADGVYEPDWQFMEDYIKSLPYSRNLEPTKPDEVVDELVEMKKEMIKMRRAMEAQQPGSINNYGTVNIYER